MNKFLTAFLSLLLGSALLLPTYGSAQSFPNEIFKKTKNCAEALSTPPAWDLPQTAQAVDEFIGKNLGRYDLFLQIPWQMIQRPKEFSNSGWNNRGTFNAKYNDQDVVVKLIRNRRDMSDDSVVREAVWTMFLNRHGLAAEFIGLTRHHDHWALVMQRVPGINTKDIHFQSNEASMAEMRRQVQILLDLEIEPMDLQFMLDQDSASVVLIDTAMFLWGGKSDTPADEWIEEMLRY